jgi:Flp pilus assembly protein TadG
MTQKQHRSGAAATELALALPVLIAFCIGTVDLGRAWYLAITVNAAARLGAEQGAIGNFTPVTQQTMIDNAKSAAFSELSLLPDYVAADATVQANITTESSTSHRITVTCGYPFKCIFPWPGVPDPIVVQSSVTMRRFR